MILVIDIGNTNIVIGCLDEANTTFVSRLATNRQNTADEYAIKIKNILELNGISPKELEGSILSSVVPPITNAIKSAIFKLLEKEPLIVGPGIKTGLNIVIDNPAQLGSDLVVDAVAALVEYKPPLIIIDMGTATTISVINEQGHFTGGMIIPGVVVSLDALSTRTSQLPSISLDAPEKVIGKNTIDCMKSGLVYGNASMIDGMITRIQSELSENATVIATGGLSQSIIKHCAQEIIYDDLLLLKGLRHLYYKNAK